MDRGWPGVIEDEEEGESRIVSAGVKNCPFWTWAAIRA